MAEKAAPMFDGEMLKPSWGLSEIIVLHVDFQVVHNYGHGPYGITLSWGCAQDAVELVQEFLLESHQIESEIQSKL